MNKILIEIIHNKEKELGHANLCTKTLRVKAEESEGSFANFYDVLKKDEISIIAECKKKSPSKGIISPNYQPKQTAKMYQAAGAAAVSVLTDERYFGGSINDLSAVAKSVNIPIICLLYTSPSPRDATLSRMPSSA